MTSLQMCKKTGNNSNLDLVNMNAYIKFGEFLSICSQDIERKRNFCDIKGHNSAINLRKMTCNNLKQGLVDINASIKLDENMSVSPHDIVRKWNLSANQAP